MKWLHVEDRTIKEKEHIILFSESLQKICFGRKEHIRYTKNEYRLKVTDGTKWHNLSVDDVQFYMLKPPHPYNSNEWQNGFSEFENPNELYFVYRENGVNTDRILVTHPQSEYGSEIGFNEMYFYWGVVCDDSTITHHVTIPDPPHH